MYVHRRPNQKQRLSREQLAEKQAQYISRNLGLDEKTNAKFIETYTDCQKEVWALGPRPHHKKGEMKMDAQTEQEIKQRFEMSEKILNIRQKYYKSIHSSWASSRFSVFTNWSDRW